MAGSCGHPNGENECCVWKNLTEEDRACYQERCEDLLNQILDLKPELLIGITAEEIAEQQISGVSWSPDVPTKDLVYKKYKSERSLSFAKDLQLNIGQVIVALGVQILDSRNIEDVDFTPLCSELFLDKKAYNTCKCMLMKGACDLCPLIEAMLCDVPAVIIALVMAYCELFSFPLRIDWVNIVYTSDNLKLDDLEGVDDLLEKYLVDNTSDSLNRRDSEDLNGILLDSQNVVRDNERAALNEQHLLNTDNLLDVCWDTVRNDLALQRVSKLIEFEPQPLKMRQFEEDLELAQKELESCLASIDSIRAEIEIVDNDKISLIDLENFEVDEWCLMTTHGLQTGAYKLAKIVRDVSAGNDRYYDLSVMSNSFEFKRFNNVPTSRMASLKYHICHNFLRDSGYCGLRVVAQATRFHRDPTWRSGTIGNQPNAHQGYGYLVFFDHGIDRYVQAPSVFNTERLVEASEVTISSNSTPGEVLSYINRWKLFPSATQSLSIESGLKLDRKNVHYKVVKHQVAEFLKRYFEAYPEYRLVSMKKPKMSVELNRMSAQTVTFIDSYRKQRRCHVVDVDRSLAVIRPIDSNKLNDAGERCLAYPCTDHSHNDDELIFRGSTHLVDALLPPDVLSNMSNRRAKHINRHQEFIDPIVQEVDISIEPKRMARKSSIPLGRLAYPSRVTHQAAKLTPAQLLLDRKLERTLIFHRHKIPNVLGCEEQFHTQCSYSCLKGLDRDPLSSQFSGKSPLMIPISCGWKQKSLTFASTSSIAKGRHKRKTQKKIVYDSPCGKQLGSLDQVAQYIRNTKSDLTIDLFCFDVTVNIFKYAESPPDDLVTNDCAKQCEHWPIPAVNSVNKEPLPEVVYCARRFPYDSRVDMSTIDKGFCSGCTCTDDCSDPSKCECQQLTRQSVKRLAKNLQPKQYGYQFRNLAGRTSTGIFECNENCSCNKRKCFNRVAQNPIMYPIQLFKTAACGWGVRTLCDIPSGAFISNYVGALLSDAITDELGSGQDAYFADLDLNDVVEEEKRTELNIEGHLDIGYSSGDEGCSDKEMYNSDSESGPESPTRKRVRVGDSQSKKRNDRKTLSGAERDVPHADSSQELIFKWSSYFTNRTDLYVIDAKSKGNIGRFLNHSCDPNVYVQHVLVDTHDLRLPWCSFFALRTIKAGEELRWNYNYAPVDEDDGRPVEHQLICHCGAPQCQGRLL